MYIYIYICMAPTSQFMGVSSPLQTISSHDFSPYSKANMNLNQTCFFCSHETISRVTYPQCLPEVHLQIYRFKDLERRLVIAKEQLAKLEAPGHGNRGDLLDLLVYGFKN